MPSRRLFPLLAVVTLMTACKLSTSTNNGIPVGVITMADALQESGRAVMTPTGVFFGATQVQFPSSHVAQDSCLLDTPSDTGGAVYSNFLDAGPAVTIQTDSTTVQLLPDTLYTPYPLIEYTLPADSAIPFTPGSNVQISIPGASGQFPSSNITASTVQPYTFGPIDTVAANDSLLITWSPAGNTATAFSLTLQFDTTAGPGTASAEIVCSAVDDGSLLIPARLVSTWQKALPGTREVRSYRWSATSTASTTIALLVLSEHRVDKLTFP